MGQEEFVDHQFHEIRDWEQDDDVETFRQEFRPDPDDSYVPRRREDMVMVCVFDWRVMDDGNCPECGRSEWQWA